MRGGHEAASSCQIIENRTTCDLGRDGSGAGLAAASLHGMSRVLPEQCAYLSSLYKGFVADDIFLFHVLNNQSDCPTNSMMFNIRLHLSFFLAFHAIMSSFVQAYKIDQSCDAKGVTVDVRNAMTSAFEMVSAAYETLTQPPLSSDAQDLVGFLFAREGANPAQLLQQGKLEKTITLLRNIRTYMSTEVTGDATVSASDVVREPGMFCLAYADISSSRSSSVTTIAGYNLKGTGTSGKIPVRVIVGSVIAID